jgi:hypothetical protein
MKKTYLQLLLIISVIIPVYTYAHPGRTNSSGCHTCRTNCSNWGLSSGEYHCHNAKAEVQPLTPIKSTYGENGTGSTRPAPEYSRPKQSVVQPIKPQVRNEIRATTTNMVSPIQPVKNESWIKSLFNWLF